MNITGLVHVNINCSDFDRSKAFYEMLGFEEYWPVPSTNTEEVARAVAMPVYRLRGALMALKDGNPRTVIDLLEWQSPRDESPPYPNLHRPGIARVALASSDIAADYAFLVAQGVEVLSEPATVPMSPTSYSKFFCFKDPDGTFLELVQLFSGD